MKNRNLLMKLKLFCRSVGGLLEVDDRMKFTQYVLSTAGNNKTALPTLQVRVTCLDSFHTKVIHCMIQNLYLYIYFI